MKRPLSRARFAGVRLSGRESAAKPFHTLGGRPVREALRRDVARRHPLQTVVANGGSGLQTFLRVPGIELHAALSGTASLRRRMAPDAGKAIGLELERHGPRAGTTHDPQQPLHMVPNLVRDHISARKITGRTESVLQFLEKSQIEIHAPIL